MSSQVNPVKQAKVTAALLQGKSARKALQDAGYSQSSIDKSTLMPAVKYSTEEIVANIKELITPEYVLSKLRHEAKTAKNAADRIRATELLGKYMAMFTDKIKNDIEVSDSDIPTRKSRLMDMITELAPKQ